MRIAVLSDIHANREALEAVLELVEELAPDQIVVLGDLVGYGPDPEFTIETVARLVSDGALCVLGNHDEAARSDRDRLTPNAREAIRWTRTRLNDDHRAFLAALPLSITRFGCQWVHASAYRPESWDYISDPEAAMRCLAASTEPLICCGHTHRPTVFYSHPNRRPTMFVPRDEIAAPLLARHRHVIVTGAVGQPRDGNPAACFALLDLEEASVTMRRVPYDSEATAAKIKTLGLSSWLGLRLLIGR
jgi:putative phosphoesterase